ncbi:NUDIX hydrolase [Haloterrigena alkaliphila]|uniref:NUDIX hydrolase n=1 Tax=Haloterrigena alkaliphila TaxID=2816475 RepID=A0A8A2V9S7_9EURY|nr:NUDIX hydrolase [Haloterrigena alkaliphila]QSW97776.1 hypothetical protein J0X25_10120 [Haloterrigena alkaliphila]
MDPSLEPDTLRDRDDVEFQTETRTLSAPEFETAQSLESRVTVGIINAAGEVLLVADGARDWTLPGVSVGANAEWGDAARRAIESLTGLEAEVDEPIRVREVAFREEGESDRQRRTYDVLVRTTPVSGRPVAEEPTIGDDDVADLIWLDRVPEGVSDGLAADVRSVLERSSD